MKRGRGAEHGEGAEHGGGGIAYNEGSVLGKRPGGGGAERGGREERREGAEYDFNDPLLESLLSEVAENGCREVVLAQLFLSPGRHAGKGGDLDEICSGFKGELIRTPLLGNHPEIISILERRIRSFQNTISTTMR